MPARKKDASAVRFNISQPAAWLAAFRKQAARQHQDLSEWLGECGLTHLDSDLRDGLPDRPKRGPVPRRKKR